MEQEGREDEANREIEMALRLDPDSWEVNREAGRLLYREGRIRESLPYFEKACTLMSSDFHSPGMLLSCYRAIGDRTALERTARLCVERAEGAIAKDPANTGAFAKGSHALASLGEFERARTWINNACMLDPSNFTVLYNCACTMLCEIRDDEAALDLLERCFDRLNSQALLRHAEADPDLDPLREHPRFKEKLAAAKERLGVSATPAAT